MFTINSLTERHYCVRTGNVKNFDIETVNDISQ